MPLSITYWIDNSGLEPREFMNELITSALCLGSEMIETTNDPEYILQFKTMYDGQEVHMLISHTDMVGMIQSMAEEEFYSMMEIPEDECEDVEYDGFTLKELLENHPEYGDMEVVVRDPYDGEYKNPCYYPYQWYCEECDSDECGHGKILVFQS